MKRCVGLVLACLMVMGLLGCGAPQLKPDTSLPKLIIGSDTYPPYVYMDNNGDITGLDVEIAREALRRMGYQAEFVSIDWERKKELVNKGDIDCIWGCFSMNGREDDYQWAGPYMVSREVVAVSEHSDIQTLSDLAGRSVAVQATTKPEEIFLARPTDDIPEVDVVLSLEDRSVQYATLDSGYVDAIAAHEETIEQYMEDYGANFRFLEPPLLVSGIGVAFSNDDPRGLADELTKTLAEMRQDGTLLAIVSRYLPNPGKYLEVEPLER
mgnify:FL=1